jgi:hypothetical protein
MPINISAVVKRECEIIDDVHKQKQLNKDNKKQKEQEKIEMQLKIKKDYPDGITDPKHIKKGYTSIVPILCNICENYRVYPFDFLAPNGKDYGTANCCYCISIINKSSRKCQKDNRTTCECGLVYYGSEDNTYKHLASPEHQKRIKLLINGIYYKRIELIQFAKQYKVPYYKSLKHDELVDILKYLMI